jgi:hypothetical protein
MEHSDVFDEVDRNASDLNNHPTVMAHRLSPKKALSSNPSREWVKKIVCEAGADDAGAVEAISPDGYFKFRNCLLHAYRDRLDGAMMDFADAGQQFRALFDKARSH